MVLLKSLALVAFAALPALSTASSALNTSSLPALHRRGYWEDLDEALIDCPCGSIFSKFAKCFVTGSIGFLLEFSDERAQNCFCEEWERSLDNCKNCISADNSRNEPTDDFKKLLYNGCKWGEYQPLMESLESASAAAALSTSTISSISTVTSGSLVTTTLEVATVTVTLSAEANSTSKAPFVVDTSVPRGISCPQALWDWKNRECRRDLTSTLTPTSHAVTTSPSQVAQPTQSPGVAAATTPESDGNGVSRRLLSGGGLVVLLLGSSLLIAW